MLLRLLVHTHRWLGIACGLLFAMWFVTGIVMMYAPMPSLSGLERGSRLPALDVSSLSLGPEEAAGVAGASPLSLRLGMLGDRPIYRVDPPSTPAAVFADSGELLEGLGREGAVAVAEAFVRTPSNALEYDALLTAPDQWTLQSRALLPLHRLRVGDPADTELYVSDRTGEIVMKTTRSGRRLAYGGAVLHWLYFTPFRARAELWAQVIIWLSVIGCVLTLSGLAWGVIRYSPGRNRLREALSGSPYTGLLRWHHYTGLVFGLFTFTWILSGGLSMDPWGWHPGTAPTRAQQEAVLGGAAQFGAVSDSHVRRSVAAMGRGEIKELSFLQFRGEPFVLGWSGSAGADRILVSADDPDRGAFLAFEERVVESAARSAMPGVGITDMAWLGEYDAYYYDRDQVSPLPVLRARFEDPRRTWLYLDPVGGRIVRKEERLTRLNRWLYHGLHSLDFPFLHSRRPLWDLVMIGLCLGGLVVSATTLVPGWRRLRRKLSGQARK